MVAQTVEDLILDLTRRRQLGEPPPVVLLGAGASVESGVEAMSGLFDLVGCAGFDEFVAYIEPRTPAERYRLLADYLQTRDPEEVTAGYRALAALCADAFFDIVLTTNLDPLLEDAFGAANLRRRDFVVLINGVIRPERVKPLLRAPSPRVKVVKLHGDLFHRLMAWTPAEMDEYLDDVIPRLVPALDGRDVLVSGHSLRDSRVRELATDTGGAIWFLSPEPVPDHLEANPLLRLVTGPDARFERVFPALATGLGVDVPAPAAGFVEPSPGEATVDDLMAAVVGIRTPRQVGMTGFLVDDPRVVVTDGFAQNIATLDFGNVELEAGDGRVLSTEVLRHETAHPFGPLVLRAPEELRVRGLRLEPAPPATGSRVQIAVAAGTRAGLALGVVADQVKTTVSIPPVGEIPHLVELRASVAPGSSGAPVVDPRMRVRGFVVAASTDPAQPRSFMYPADRWTRALG